MVEESNPSHSFELIAQHEALTDKLTIQNNKVRYSHDRHTPVQTQNKTRQKQLCQ